MLKNIPRFPGFLFFLCIFCLSMMNSLWGEKESVNLKDIKIKDYVLPKHHPLQRKLKKLFKDPEMFQSPESLNEAGFHVLGKLRRGFLVASHPNIPNYLIKKFQNDVPREEQIDNYITRIQGARELKRFIKLHHLRHIVVPQKWLYELPEQFSEAENGKRTFVLVVEKIDICSGGKNREGEVAQRYYNMDLEVLRELCLVLYHFRGLDSGLQNMPFTYQNQIAFIDTEHWKQTRKEFLRYAKNYLSPDRQEYALSVYQELLEQDKNKYVEEPQYANTPDL